MDNLEYYNNAIDIISNADEEGIILRLLGSTAIMHHCPEHKSLFHKMERALTDIDVMAYSRHRGKIEKYFEKLGFKSVYRLMGKDRQIYEAENSELHIDVFYDKLNFCHPIDLRKRLELDSPTVTITDLLLEKMQIVQINKKDIIDSIILLLEHDIGRQGNRETIELDYLTEKLGSDWGFYYTFQNNLEKISKILDDFEDTIGRKKTECVRDKMEKIRNKIENSPKTFIWKIRSIIGTRIQWYQEVEDVIREVQ